MVPIVLALNCLTHPLYTLGNTSWGSPSIKVHIKEGQVTSYPLYYRSSLCKYLHNRSWGLEKQQAEALGLCERLARSASAQQLHSLWGNLVHATQAPGAGSSSFGSGAERQGRMC